ncbi:MAG: hypothetical protein FJY88_03995 [Candidatus Eisenbacteria bacterium]|nr:hypothetical protein [Candidatus Eisenbacteria bacterium]
MHRSRLLTSVVTWLQKHAAADRNSVTITITPAQAERAFQVELPRWSLRLLAAILISAFALILAGGVLYGKLIRDAIVLREIRQENQVLRAGAAKLLDLEQEVKHLERVRRQLYAIAGVPDSGTAVIGVSEAPDPHAIVAEAEPGDWSHGPDGEGEGPILNAPHIGPVSRGYATAGGKRPEHLGVDIAGREGAPVSAAGSGEVVFAGWDTAYGNMLVVRHRDGWETRYGHNQSLLVSHGDSVKVGQTIALLGSTGQSSAPHLHFEVLRRGAPVDPGAFFPLYGGRP